MSAAAREAFINQFLADTESILPGSQNTKISKDYLESLNDEQFESLVAAIESGTTIIPLYTPVLSNPKLTVERNLAVAEQWGVEFFQQVRLTDPTVPNVTLLTPKRYPILFLPIRRQAQTIAKKMSVPLDNNSIDDMTGQVTGDSKGSALTFPELQALNAQGLTECITEFMAVRGGNTEAYTRMDQAIVDLGSTTLTDSLADGTRPRATETLSTLLRSAHIQNNL